MSGRAVQLAIHVSWSKAREPGLRKSQPFHTAEQQSKFTKLEELKQKAPVGSVVQQVKLVPDACMPRHKAWFKSSYFMLTQLPDSVPGRLQLKGQAPGFLTHI